MKLFHLTMALILILCAFQRTPAQVLDYDLKSFKTTDYERSSLDLNFDLDQYSNRKFNYLKKIFYPTTLIDDEINNSELGKFEMDVNATSSYSRILLNRDRSSDLTLSLSINNNYLYNKESQNDIIKTNNNSFDGEYKLFGSYNTNIFYNDEKNRFLLLGIESHYRISHASVTDNTANQNPTNGTRLHPFDPIALETKIGHGHGRIEFVEDAVEAMYILNELNAKSLSSKTISNKDITELANKITTLKKERYFDSRIHRQKTMKELIELLVSNGIIANENIDVYNTLADYHYFAGIETRYSGHKLEYYLKPGTSFYRNSTKDVSYQNDFTKVLSFGIDYENHKPLSIKWQRSYSISAEANRRWSNAKLYQYDTKKEINSSTLTNLTLVNASYSIGYYPTTRTHLSTRLSGGISNMTRPDLVYRSTSSSLSMDINGYYYISERLRLNGNFFITGYRSLYDNSNDTSVTTSNNRSINQTLTASLSYYLF